MKKGQQEINKKCEEIEKIINDIEKLIPSLNDHLTSLTKGLNAVFISFQRIHEGIKKRQFLIDFQCNQEIFGGSVHNEYHRVTEQLDIDFDIYLSSIKTCLNRLPILVCEAVGHQERRDLNSSSFGSFLNSIKDKNFQSDILRQLRKVFLRDGKKIDQTIHTYRDKSIEHIRQPSSYGLVSDEKGIRRKHKTEKSYKNRKQDSLEELRSRIKPQSGKKLGTVTKIGLENGRYAYYVHLATEHKPGVHLKKGKPIGYVSDGNSGHFNEYGSHGHVFTSPDLPIEELNHEGYSSPSAFESIALFTDFLRDSLNIIFKYINDNSDKNI